jgi:hypothetical protein
MVTKDEITKRLGIHNIIKEKNRTKLPKTIELVNNCIETHKDFIARKIMYDLKELLKKNIDITDEKRLKQHFKKNAFYTYKAVIESTVNSLI